MGKNATQNRLQQAVREFSKITEKYYCIQNYPPAKKRPLEDIPDRRHNKMRKKVIEQLAIKLHDAWRKKRIKENGWHIPAKCKYLIPCEECHPCVDEWGNLTDKQKELALMNAEIAMDYFQKGKGEFFC